MLRRHTARLKAPTQKHAMHTHGPCTLEGAIPPEGHCGVVQKEQQGVAAPQCEKGKKNLGAPKKTATDRHHASGKVRTAVLQADDSLAARRCSHDGRRAECGRRGRERRRQRGASGEDAGEHWRAQRLGPEVGRMQARQKNREVTACDKCYGEMYGSGRMRAKQEQGCKQRAGNTTRR